MNTLQLQSAAQHAKALYDRTGLFIRMYVVMDGIQIFCSEGPRAGESLILTWAELNQSRICPLRSHMDDLAGAL